MKILIVDTVSFNRAPYLKWYIDACKKNNVDFDLFLWDRTKTSHLEKDGNMFVFHHKCEFGGNKIKKILPMILYRKKLLQTIKIGQYTHLILINTLAAVMISNFVLNNFDGKYIMDIRDYTYEKYEIYQKIENKLIEHSAFTTLSSRGFLKFIKPNNKIIINHNIGKTDFKIQKPTLNAKEVVKIGFIGSVRYKKENLNLINALGNNNDYKLIYIGEHVAGCDLESECIKNEIKNVSFIGKYNNDEKPKLYENVDIINSLYGNFSLETTTAIPNRLYDALLYMKPIITTENTYLSEVVKKYGIGISLPGSQNYNQKEYRRKIKDYIKNFEPVTFINNAEKLLKIVMNEQEIYRAKIDEFLQCE